MDRTIGWCCVLIVPNKCDVLALIGDISLQSRLRCNHRAIQLKMFQKILKKILNVHLNLLHIYIKFQGQIRPPEVKKRQI